jgi:hypothetical protein
VLGETLAMYGAIWANGLGTVAGPTSQATEASVDMLRAAATLSLVNLDITDGASFAANWIETVSELQATNAECA